MATAGISSADSMLWWIALLLWGKHITPGMLVGLVLAVGIPLALGGYWLHSCSARVADDSRRCRQPRDGFLRRCHQHRNQMVTAYDAAGACAPLLALINLFLFI